MKSLLGLKTKAQNAAKDNVARSSAAAQGRKPSFGLNISQSLQNIHQEPASSAGSGSSVGGSLAGRQEPGSSEGSSVSLGMDPVLVNLLGNARSEAVRREFLSTPPEEYTQLHDVTVLVGTYNVNGRRPPDKLDLRPWLDVTQHEPAIVAVGLQEVVPLNTTNVVMGAGLESASAWDALIAQALNFREKPSVAAQAASESFAASLVASTAAPQQAGEGDTASLQTAPSASTISNEDEYQMASEELAALAEASSSAYVQVAAKQMVGVYLSIWVRQSLLPHVHGTQVTSVGTGVLGYLGNKGAVTIRMRVFDSGVCFIAAHLSSGENEGDELKRNYDYSEIIRRGAFHGDGGALDPDSLAAAASAASLQEGVSKVLQGISSSGHWGTRRGLLDSEYAIWMGDLNYRLSMPDDKARKCIRKGDLESLIKADELVNMLKTRRAFQGWTEGHLSFPPTFKFKRGTNQYLGSTDDDPQEGPETPEKADALKEKRRTPAWTDRVLFRGGARPVKQLTYTSANLLVSDHKPVCSNLRLQVHEYVRLKVEAAVDAARRVVDSREMASMPRCELEPTSADMGNVFYATRKELHIRLLNPGQVAANFQFMPLPGSMFGNPGDKEFRSTPRWATVHPEQGVLEPGAEEELQLTVWINGGSEGTAQLVAGTQGCKLDAILVLRVQNGNDVFLSVTGTYRPSFFGVSLQTLALLPRPLVPPSMEVPVPTSSRSLQVNVPSAPDAEQPEHGGGAFYSPASSLHEGSSPGPQQRGTEFARDRSHDDSGAPSLPSASAQPAAAGATGAGRQAAVNLMDSDMDAAEAQEQSSSPGQGSHQQQPPEQREVAEQQEGAVQDAGHLDVAPATNRVPSELQQLAAFLRAEQRLHTPGLFVSSADHVLAAPRDATSSVTMKGSGADAIRLVRQALDKGQQIPPQTSPHDVAATLLAFFASLPVPLLPEAAAQVCDVCVPDPSAAASLLADALGPVEWAAFKHVTSLLHEALTPPAATSNGLTASALAALLAEVWFSKMPTSYAAAGHDLKPENVTELQKLAERMTLVAERRAAFISLFLEQ